MTKVVFRGVTLDDRSVLMIQWAERKANFIFKIAQGSYSTGVAASAGTHDGGGAVDFSVNLMLPAKRNKMLNALKDAGFAAWYRTKADGFSSAHVHAVAIGCVDLAPLAKFQVTAFDKNQTGLKGNAADVTYRPNPRVKFNQKLNAPVSRDKVVPVVPAKKVVASTKKAPAPKK